MRKKLKVVIIGAGSAVFTKNLLGDLLLYTKVPLGTISLVDINTQKLAVMEQVIRRMAAQVGRGDVKIEATDNRRDVLPGADYVINAISVGGSAIYQRDIEICDKYNVRVVVGDIINPTGIFRMLREYPDILGIVRDMEELCPDAYFFNYSNPMAPICLALGNVTKIKTFGFCHSIQGSAEGLANYLGVDMSRVSYWAAGINHMAWYLRYNVDGEDAYPELMDKTKTIEDMHKLSELEGMYSKMNSGFSDAVRLTIMRNFGYYVSESPYHMSEYVPYFRKNPDAIEKWHVGLRWWLAHELGNDDYYDGLKKSLADGENIDFKMTHEYAPKIINAISTGEPFRANLNVMDTGLITNLPNDCCVEVPCYADSEGIHPCYVGDLPDGPCALNLSNIAMHRLMARAANEKKYEWIYQAAQTDPYTAAMCDLEQIRNMTSELIENNKQYLGDFN